MFICFCCLRRLWPCGPDGLFQNSERVCFVTSITNNWTCFPTIRSTHWTCCFFTIISKHSIRFNFIVIFRVIYGVSKHTYHYIKKKNAHVVLSLFQSLAHVVLSLSQTNAMLICFFTITPTQACTRCFICFVFVCFKCLHMFCAPIISNNWTCCSFIVSSKQTFNPASKQACMHAGIFKLFQVISILPRFEYFNDAVAGIFGFQYFKLVQ